MIYIDSRIYPYNFIGITTFIEYIDKMFIVLLFINYNIEFPNYVKNMYKNFRSIWWWNRNCCTYGYISQTGKGIIGSTSEYKEMEEKQKNRTEEDEKILVDRFMLLSI